VKVVVTRESGQNESLVALLPSGAEVKEVPLTSTRYFADDEVAAALKESRHVGVFCALVVTSARAARYAPLAVTALAPGASVLCVGGATAKAVEDESISVAYVGERGAADLAHVIEEGPVLLLGALETRDELLVALQRRGLVAEKVSCYETVPEELSADGADVLRVAEVVFIGAPSAWRVAQPFVSDKAWVVVPGATTGNEVRRQHGRVIEGWGESAKEHLRAL